MARPWAVVYSLVLGGAMGGPVDVRFRYPQGAR